MAQPLTPRRMQPAGPGFYIDWEDTAVGLVLKDGAKSDPKGDFAISLTALIEAGSSTGYLVTVKRGIDKTQRECFFSAESATCKSKFMTQINNSFGSGGMSLAFNDMQFSAFIQFLKADHGHNLPIYKAACTIGQQPCLTEWVLGKDVIIDCDGNTISQGNSKYVWLDATLLGDCAIPSQEVVPSIHLPLSSSILAKLMSLMEITLKHNYISSLLVLAGGVMSLHYSTLTTTYSGCPITVALGPAETGKTTAVKAALAITGTTTTGLYVKGSNAFFLERASASSLPFAIDDPPKQTSRNTSVDVSDLIIDLYNGGKTANLRKGALKPKTAPLVATNFDIKSDERVVTRANVVCFSLPTVAPSTDEEEAAFAEIEDLLLSGELSSAIGWAISVGKQLSSCREDIRELKKLTQLQGRSSQNWAILLFFVKQLLEAGHQEVQFDDVVEHIRTMKCTSTPSKSPDHYNGVVVTALNKIVSVARMQPLSKVLQYLRTATFVRSREVVAIVLNDIESSISTTEIKSAIKFRGIGDINCTKDFLDPASSMTTITRNVSNKRRKCCVIYLDELPADLKENLKQVTTSSPAFVNSEAEKMEGDQAEQQEAHTEQQAEAEEQAEVQTEYEAEQQEKQEEQQEEQTEQQAEAEEIAEVYQVEQQEMQAEQQAEAEEQAEVKAGRQAELQEKQAEEQKKKGRKRKAQQLSQIVRTKRPTRQNSRLPNWSKTIDPNNPLGQ